MTRPGGWTRSYRYSRPLRSRGSDNVRGVGVTNPVNDPTDALGRVVAVVVTYNRAQLLQACLDGLASQSRPLDAVVVIDNASSDGSGEVAKDHPLDADVRTLATNHGGAGGFAAGLAVALREHDPDWVWLMDDDTVPTPTALAGLVDAVDSYDGDRDRLAVLSSTAVWTDGRVHPMNVSRERIDASRAEREAAGRVGSRAIRTASFVAIALRADRCREAGLPLADYFIWGDDTEYSGRLLRGGLGLQVAGSVVEHRTVAFFSWQAEPGPRFYHDVRNKLWLLTRSRAFRWFERLLYGGSAALGWIRTVGRSQHRRELLGHARRGLRDAVRGGPRSTREVLAGLGEVSESVAAIEREASTRERR